MPFLSDLHTTDHETEWDKSVLDEPLVYQSIREGRVFTATRGFVTNLASIPRWLLPIIPKVGRHRKAAVIHDMLYDKNTAYLKMERKDCDLVFYEAMKDLNVPRWKAYSMYQAVRALGWYGFRKDL